MRGRRSSSPISPAKALEIARFIEQAGPQQNDISRRGGRALTEPQRPGVIFFGVVNGLERLRPDTLHIPQDEKIRERSDAQRIVGIFAKLAGTDIDGGAIGVFHAATAGASREMIEEQISLKGPIFHPERWPTETGCRSMATIFCIS